MKTWYYRSNSIDVYENLAIEEYIFEYTHPDDMAIILWRNMDTIVLGKHQNAYAQINEDIVLSHNIKVARRLSGGGTVYHDLGNINYTVISPATSGSVRCKMKEHLFTNRLLCWIKELGVPAIINDRGDMLVGDSKFSGNAEYYKRDRGLHHGTILYDTNLEVLRGCLRESSPNIICKSIESVRSKVANIRPYMKDDIGTEDFIHMLESKIMELDNVYKLDVDVMNGIISDNASKYASVSHIYGRPLRYEVVEAIRINLTGFIMRLRVERGKVVEVDLELDYKNYDNHNSYKDSVDIIRYKMSMQLKGEYYSPSKVEQVINELEGIE